MTSQANSDIVRDRAVVARRAHNPEAGGSNPPPATNANQNRMETQTAIHEPRVCSVQIYWTKDYGSFKFLRGNRDLNEPKIKRIIASVNSGLAFFQYCPIMVNDDFYIIDGQHRFAVCQQLKINVYYVIVPNFSLRQIAEMNNNASKWKDKDFLNCYIDVGVKDYEVLMDFSQKYNLNLRIASSLLMFGKVKYSPTFSSDKDAFREGKFQVKHLDIARKLIIASREFITFTDCFSTRNFLQAIEILMASANYDQDDLISKLKLHNLKIEQKNSPKEYLSHLEDLYNYKNSKRKRIY